MRVHIFSKTRPPRILGHLAYSLAEHTDWTLGDTWEPDAFNYCISYRYDVPTPFGSYFFHLGMRPVDQALWKKRATDAALRVVTAPLYVKELSAYGPTVCIVPPLDREKFQPVAHAARRGAPVAGVAGFVALDGRKGETMLRTVLGWPAAQRFDWKAIGLGWPVPTTLLHNNDTLHEFYQSLDVLVCTSLSEGVPYPPLEALACGIPVVIPRGVGLLDMLPDIPGITRYDAGDVQDLSRALQEVDLRADGDALRAATEPFTMEGWVQGHVDAIMGLEVMRRAED
jgi:hypothetical protein